MAVVVMLVVMRRGAVVAMVVAAATAAATRWRRWSGGRGCDVGVVIGVVHGGEEDCSEGVAAAIAPEGRATTNVSRRDRKRTRGGRGSRAGADQV